MLDNFQHTLNASPLAAAEAMRAATTPDPKARPPAMLLQNFGFVSPNMVDGGTYSPSTNTLNLPPLNLQSPPPAGVGKFQVNDLTFVIGHEVGHSFNSAAKEGALTKLGRDIAAVVRLRDTEHNYTPAAAAYIDAARQDEARAQIDGWNALVSRQQALTGVPPTLASMSNLTDTGRYEDFVRTDPVTNTVVPLSGLTFNADGPSRRTIRTLAAVLQ